MMQRRLLITAAILVVGLSLPAVAGEARLLGFTKTRGGAGGTILRVTHLNPDGPGSLRAALETKGKRIVVFEVGGVLDLGEKSLSITEPFVTIAGETAPAPGITLMRGGLSIRTHDVIVNHLRVRPGDAGKPKKSGWEPDGIGAYGGDAHDILVDHCSITWAVDENASASGPRLEGPDATARRVTFRHCIIAEALSHATHKKGEHSKGSLIHDFCREIAIVGNLYAHNFRRNPYFKAHTTGVIVNNLIYNPGRYAIQLSYVPGEWRRSKIKPENARVSIVGNVLIHGTNTHKNLALVEPRGDAYLEDNLAFKPNGKSALLVGGTIKKLETKPVWPDGLIPLPASQVEAEILKTVGARPRDRDAIDQRIIEDVRARKGRIIDSQDEVGGYPQIEMTTRTLKIPKKNVEAWLAKMAAAVEP